MSQSDPTRTVYLSTPIETIKAPRISLTVTKGPAKGEVLASESPVLRVGAASDNDLMVEDGTVSRNHFRIQLDPRGYRIRDLASKNGVFVDSMAVLDGYLPQTCKISIGDTVIKFKQERETRDVEFATGNRLGNLLGISSQMRHLFALIQRVADTEATILVEGESGTGKELTAQALHDLSGRAKQRLVVLDCSAIPESIIESELFGHLKGAFTGAVTSRRGAVDNADGGTLFLDEIGELPLTLQGKVLRLIEAREIKPVGADQFKKVDLRILAATNRNLKEEVGKGTFRQDLYYRLAVMKLRIAPLRERLEDLEPLVQHFLEFFSNRDGRQYTVPHNFMTPLMGYHFPGNVRELRNMIERACLLSEGVELELELPTRTQKVDTDFLGFEHLLTMPYKDAKETLVSTFEERYWNELLEKCGNNISEASRRGGIHRKSLEYLLKKFRKNEE
jgi:transcriptional regulator with PAS, ATPase and Fis domain